MDCSPPGSSVHGIFQMRILEWVAISLSRGSSWPRGWTRISCVSWIGRWILYHCATWEAQWNIKLWKDMEEPSVQFSSVQSLSCVQDSLWPHGLQHARLPCPQLTPRVNSHSCPLSQWCHPTISPSVIPFSSHLQSFPAFLSDEAVLHIRWPKYWSFSFSISPSNEYSGLLSFKMDWLDLLAAQRTLKSSPTPQFKSINSSVLSFLYSSTHIHMWLLEKP